MKVLTLYCLFCHVLILMSELGKQGETVAGGFTALENVSKAHKSTSETTAVELL